MVNKKIPLSLHRNYVNNWTIEDAIREIIQNALDTENYNISHGGGIIEVNSYGGCLPEDFLLLGNGSKKEGDSSRGMYGEGLKVALLVLCRNNISIVIKNGEDTWTPSLEHSDLYGCECLHINIEKDVNSIFDCVEIEIAGLQEYTLNKVVDNTLVMQDDYNSHETDYGTILLDDNHKGKVFVGGLFVDNFKSDYGYDFPPDTFPLDRDRRALKPFEVQCKCREVFDEYSCHVDSEEEADKLISSISNKDSGLEYADISKNNDALNSAADRLYKEKYDGKVVVSDFDEYNDQREAGNKVVYEPNRKLVEVLKNTDSYKTFSIGMNKVEKKDVPTLLDNYLEKYSDEMSTDAFNDFEDMIQEIHKLV